MRQERITIGQQELMVGDQLNFELSSVPASIGPISISGEIEDIRGGGFYGRAILLKDHVIKTTEPDSWHLLWRRINWAGYPFPPQSSEYAAQLDHISTRVIHLLVPKLTNGQVITPDSYGYTKLDSLGFAQVLERVHGHPARFNTEEENKKIKEARRLTWDIGVALGLEHAAQIHPDNPFGKQNIWLTDDGRYIWLDTLPAIVHTEAVLPTYRFPFHKEIRESIGNGKITFNRLHTDKIRAYISDNPSLIDRQTHSETEYLLQEYDAIRPEYAEEMKRERKDLVIEDAVNRGLVNKGEAARLHQSRAAYSKFLARTILEPALSSFSEFIKNTPLYKIGFEAQFQEDVKQFLISPDFRREKIIENSILKGFIEAYVQGIATEEELSEAWNVANQPLTSKEEARKLAATYISLQSWYAVSGAIINTVSFPLIASTPFAEDPGARLATGLFVDWVVPPAVRAASTWLAGKMTEQDLHRAIKYSAIPKAGWWLAIPADLAYRQGNKSENIWHYTKRALIASLSKTLRPWGGWNSDLEEKLWNALRVEKW